MTLQKRLQELHQNPDTAPPDIISQALASIKKDILEIIGEDESVGDVPPFEGNWEQKEIFDRRNQLRAELRERLERYIG